MKNLSKLYIAFGLIILLPLYSQDSQEICNVYIHSPSILLAFKSDAEVDNYLKKHSAAEDYFLVGVYHYKEIIFNPKRWGFFSDKEEFIEKGIEYLEKSRNLNPNHAPTLAVLGTLLSMSAEYTKYPKVLVTTKNAQRYINSSVTLEPNSIEFLFLKINNDSYFPYKFYPNLEKVILKDYEKFVKLYKAFISPDSGCLAQLEKQGNDQQQEWFRSSIDHINFRLGIYYRDQVENNQQAQVFFKKIGKESPLYAKAQKEID